MRLCCGVCGNDLKNVGSVGKTSTTEPKNFPGLGEPHAIPVGGHVVVDFPDGLIVRKS